MPFYYGIDSEGYFRVCQNDSERSGTQVGHWVVARAGLMGPIPSFEEQKTVIHHKDFDGTNNDPSNLEFMGDHDHSAYHRSLVKRNEYWQSEAFEEARKAALAAKAATPEGYAEFAARADRLNAYLAEHAEVREHINHQVSRNNRTSERREQSREIASRTYACGICGREIKSVIALNSHFRHKHAEDYSWDACYDGTPINHEVVAVRQTGERADVFCLQVPSHGNFALAAGVFVHNCRMMMSVYPAEMGLMLHDQGGREDLKRVMREETRFGLGASFAQGERRQHAVLDDPDWNATPLLRGLKDKAYAQLGTSGTGNHFVDAGLLDVSEAGADALGLPAGTYLALMTHSGSRGPGATIANHYSKLAKKHSKLPKSLQQLAYFDLDSELGQEYWLSMNLAGRFASACHHTMHEAFARRLGETPLTQVENHHNFCIAGDQIIPTPSGPKCMDEIRSGDVIYAFDEEQGVVPASVATAWCSGEKEIYEVSTQNRRIRCTGDHQLLAIEVTKQRREGCPGLRKRVGTFTWKKASQLRRGDILVCTDQYYGQDSAVGIATARLAGAFLGDGWIRQKNPHISGYSVGFAIGTEEDEHTKRYKQLVEAVLPSANWKNNAPGAFGLSCSSKAVHSDIRELELGATSAEARVPSYIYTAPFEEKIAFLSGYFDADGSVSGNEKNAGRGTIAATSRDLVYGLREVAIACGLQVTPVRHRRAQTNYGTMDVYRCVLAADAMMRLDLWHQQKRENQRATRYQRPQGLQASKRGYLDLPAGTFAQSVRSVTPTGQKEDVYDLTIDHPSHAFVCEGIVVHNCWKETWRDRTVYVHRKGATPAHEGVLGIIPGSQGHDSFIAQGKGNAASLNSASHGAGRVMSRTQAFKTIPRQARNRWLEERGIELLAGGMDEAPQAYKDIEEVLAVQDDLIATIARFRPKLVLMADDGKSEG
jgi:RNA-splicing ligase RtcB